ncbi:MAG TPA: beta-N-acetylhexosaminidase [Verrucomicrobiae bacterium]|nr:beta-N-acetylhexosaminidase [Verrucomicrobiae bacterium]
MSAKHIITIIFCLLTLTAFATEIKNPAIIPLPQKMEAQKGNFEIQAERRVLGLFSRPGTKIVVDVTSRETGEYLAEWLRKSTGFPIEVVGIESNIIKGNILLTTQDANENLGAEGYDLTVTPDSAVVRAPQSAGVFYGAQTLLQLLPPEIFSSNTVKNISWKIPCVTIEDQPRFKWRGLMLDVSRHFYDTSEVEAILDAMALHKLNMFHWHLTDDQGWRIEIKKYPQLTSVGAWRSDVGFNLDPKSTTHYDAAGRYGGFYTQDDIRKVVAYAAARHITIVPEIEMPGHSTAALAAYPQFSCTGGPFTNGTDAGIFNGIYDPAKEQTFQFLDDVLTEVFQLFPGKYIHIGGDEVPKDTWKNSADCQALMKREGLKNEEELQSWFTRRIEKFVSAHGRTMIGWSEILQGGLPQNAAVMDWIGGAKEASAAGHDVVMSPTAYCYLDFYQSSNHVTEPKAAAWAPALTLHKVYSFDPMPTNLPPQLQSHILGTQGNLWTEWVPNLQHAEYMIFPRECALAEITWSSGSSRDWDDFMRRLQIHARRLDELGINYRHSSLTETNANVLP